MLFRNKNSLVLLVLSVFLLTLVFITAEAKTTDKKSKSPNKTWAKITGFRSAKFGMDEKKVIRAIGKDFKISRSKVKRKVHPTEKTTNLELTVPKLMATGGTAKIGYILGMESKKLVQVNVVWGFGTDKDFNPEGVVGVANLLRDHFTKKRYQKGLVLNGRVNDSTIVVFRGRDEKGSQILLILNQPIAKKGEDPAEAIKRTNLRLAYQLAPDTPDILSIKEGDF
jgi:hypothetical protein